MWRQADEARGARGVLLIIGVPLLFAALVALVWLVPAAVVSMSAPVSAAESQEEDSSWVTGDRLGKPAPGSPDPTQTPAAGTGVVEPTQAPDDPTEAAAEGADEPGTPPGDPADPAQLPSEAGVDDQGVSKTLGEVMDGSTVLRAGDSGLPVRFVQQRLNTAGIALPESATYDDATAAAVTSLQEKFALTQTGRVNRYTLDTLLRITERGPALPAECTSGTVVCVDKTQKLVRLVRDGAVVMALDARFGALGAATKEGLFEVYDKRADDFSTDFGVPMKYSLYFAGGQAVHYSEVFAAEGYTGGSAGCVNTRDLQATRAMFEQVPKGAKVFVYR